MLSYIQALEHIFSVLPQLKTIKCDLDKSNNYFIAQDIISPMDLPAFNNSGMDGYAIQSADTQEASKDNPAELKIVGESLAGHPPEMKVKKGECLYIATGAGIPAGADSVIPVEDVELNGTDQILIMQAVKKSQHIRFAGEEVKTGDPVFAKGTKITPAHIGMMATFGITQPLVYKKPSVGFIATGDELVDPGDNPGPGQIRNSNTSVIKAMVEETGCTFNDMGIARDNQTDLNSIIAKADLPDVLITSAGVSMGKYDLVTSILEKLGLNVIFWKVAIKPGKPLVFGTIGTTLFFGLPGNPVSGAVVFRQFIEPLLIAMSGGQLMFRATIKAKSLDAFNATRGRLNFARGLARYRGGWEVASAGKQGSHMISGIANANCLILIPPDKIIEQGDEVDIQLNESLYVSRGEFNKSFY